MTLSLKSIIFGTTAAATVAAGMTLTAMPAQALSFGDTLKFSTEGNSVTTFDPGTGFLNFGTIEINTPSVFGNSGTNIPFTDLTLTSLSPTSWGFNPATPFTFITGLNDELPTPGTTRIFKLASLTLNKTTTPGGNVWSANFNGFFEPPTPGAPGTGGFASFGSFTLAEGGSTIAGQITVVPTPALLPGLIGMGIAALRKRKAAQEVEQVS